MVLYVSKGSQGSFPLMKVFMRECCSNCHTNKDSKQLFLAKTPVLGFELFPGRFFQQIYRDWLVERDSRGVSPPMAFSWGSLSKPTSRSFGSKPRKKTNGREMNDTVNNQFRRRFHSGWARHASVRNAFLSTAKTRQQGKAARNARHGGQSWSDSFIN